ncbi:MAG: ribonuclease H-like domain-containing protein [Candidatus Limnocylindrales bacterium]|nr:ribonuclease H-like domain-containing protein [Candidatus Limnocylindrales bacterium]
MIDSGATLARRLERYRAAMHAAVPRDTGPPAAACGQGLAERLAAAMDGEIVVTTEGTIVRCEVPTRPIPVDRERLAALPGQPPPNTPLVCLDTETTGLATAAGTVAWLIGLGWWEGDRFRQVQLLLPDHADERALLTSLATTIAPNAWLVTYNGRGFDWPLLVARYRLARRSAPVHGGHLDLLPIVRRLFRHRMADARLRTAEAELLGLHRVGDVEGWEIPSRYLQFLRGGSADGLVEVVRHNDQDVRSLARLLAHLEMRFGDAHRRAEAAPGDLAGLARAFAREHRLGEALACLDAAMVRAVDGPVDGPLAPIRAAARETTSIDDEPWWSPRRPADFGGRTRQPPILGGTLQTAAFDAPWTTERIAIDRAHLLRRLGRHQDAAEAWEALAAGTGRCAILATIELAKLQEHRLGDRIAAMGAVLRGFSLIERRGRLGRPEPALEADLVRRHDRLQRRGAIVARRSIA